MELISVLMPIYNDEKYIDRAVQSILNQTYANFELLLLLEYGSNESSKKIAYSYKDSRICVIENTKRLGIAESLNVGIRNARGKYIARMDTDDICLKNRFEEQIKCMEKYGLDVLGSSAYINGNRFKRLIRPQSQDEITITALFFNPFIHPSVMIRKETIISNNLFYKDLRSSEDYELWTRMILNTSVGNLKKSLLNYTIRNDNKTHKDTNFINADVHKLQKEYAEKFGISIEFDGIFDSTGLDAEEFRKREKYLVDILDEFYNCPCCRKIVAKEASKLYVHNGHFGLITYIKNILQKTEKSARKSSCIYYVYYSFVEWIKGRLINR